MSGSQRSIRKTTYEIDQKIRALLHGFFASSSCAFRIILHFIARQIHPRRDWRVDARAAGVVTGVLSVDGEKTICDGDTLTSETSDENVGIAQNGAGPVLPNVVLNKTCGSAESANSAATSPLLFAQEVAVGGGGLDRAEGMLEAFARNVALEERHDALFSAP